jgi:hypothetical protein
LQEVGEVDGLVLDGASSRARTGGGDHRLISRGRTASCGALVVLDEFGAQPHAGNRGAQVMRDGGHIRVRYSMKLRSRV